MEDWGYPAPPFQPRRTRAGGDPAHRGWWPTVTCAETVSAGASCELSVPPVTRGEGFTDHLWRGLPHHTRARQIYNWPKNVRSETGGSPPNFDWGVATKFWLGGLIYRHRPKPTYPQNLVSPRISALHLKKKMLENSKFYTFQEKIYWNILISGRVRPRAFQKFGGRDPPPPRRRRPWSQGCWLWLYIEIELTFDLNELNSFEFNETERAYMTDIEWAVFSGTACL